MTIMAKRPWLPASGPLLMQGWFPEQTGELAGAFADLGGVGVLRLPAFPASDETGRWFHALKQHAGKGHLALDIKGLRSGFDEVLAMAKAYKALFLAHGPQLFQQFKDALAGCGLPRVVFVKTLEEANMAAQEGAEGLVVERSQDTSSLLAAIYSSTGLPLVAEYDGPANEAEHLLDQPGVVGLQLRSSRPLQDVQASDLPLLKSLSRIPDAVTGRGFPPLRPLTIRHLTLDQPLLQGGMGVGVSWGHLAGSVAKAGCGGIISAIGTGYHNLNAVETAQSRPLGAANFHDAPALARIVAEARDIAQGSGAVGVNILCAIEGYPRIVRAAVEAGAQMIISGAGLPLALPEYVGDADVALIPIVSSARALGVICKTWQRKFNRLPDAVVLEGPESGGHQGFSMEQCVDPAFALDKLLPEVVGERNQWGDFPVIAAGGVWDREDIDRLMALGAGGVQMATRFIGTLECDADPVFKDVILRATREQIRLVQSPVGMPGRVVQGGLQQHIQAGSAPKVCCISECISVCDRGKRAQAVGYCIADRLADARVGKAETGLYFTGSNGWRLQDLVSVQELIAEITKRF